MRKIVIVALAVLIIEELVHWHSAWWGDWLALTVLFSSAAWMVYRNITEGQYRIGSQK